MPRLIPFALQKIAKGPKREIPKGKANQFKTGKRVALFLVHRNVHLSGAIIQSGASRFRMRPLPFAIIAKIGLTGTLGYCYPSNY